MILLDTSFLIDLFRNGDLGQLIPDDETPAVTVISYYEIMAGVRRLKAKKEEKFFRQFFADTEIQEFTLAAAEVAGEIGARMALAGKPVNAFDILIAGIAGANHASAIISADQDFAIIAPYAGLDVIRYDRDRHPA